MSTAEGQAGKTSPALRPLNPSPHAGQRPQYSVEQHFCLIDLCSRLLKTRKSVAGFDSLPLAIHYHKQRAIANANLAPLPSRSERNPRS